MAAPNSTPSLREMTRDAVRTRIADVAVDLFAERGFDEVTVEQVAARAGISTRSFNRYFPTKEDAVLGDAAAWGELVRAEVASRPIGEPAWESLRSAFEALLDLTETRSDRQKRVMQVLSSTASLRARNMEKHLLWAQLLTPLIEGRLDGADARLRAASLVQAALAGFDVAVNAWADPAEHRTPGELLTISFAALRA